MNPAELAIDLVGVGIVALDAEGRVRFANARAVSLLGDRVRVGESAAELIGESGSGEGAAPRVLPVGEGAARRWIEVHLGSAVEGCVCVVVDITERVAARRQADREAELFARVMETSNAGITVLVPDGHIVYANAAAERILGIKRVELEGMSYDAPVWKHSDVDGGPWTEDLQPFTRVLRTRAPVSDVRHAIEAPGLGRRILSINGAPVLDAAGEVEQLVFTVTDVTDRYAAERERAHLHREAERLARVDSLSALAGGVAHDFNNLLGSVIGGITLALDGLEPGHPAREDLAIAMAGAERAADLTRQLLAFSGRGHAAVGPIDLSDTLRATEGLARALASSRVPLTLELGENLPEVSADALQVRQVVMNLVQNAAEAVAGTRGAIAIRTGQVRVGEAELRAASTASPHALPGRYAYVEVQDTGPGMSPEVLASVFEPFYTTKPGGFGLGLSAVLGVVRGHAGFATVDSAPGRGTRIRIAFPVADTAPPLEEVSTDTRTAEQPVGALVAMVVDDNELVLRTSARLLRRLGYETDTACGGLDALARLREDPERYHLLLVDVRMPDLGGDHLLEHVRALRPDVPVVLMSGFTDLRLTELDPHSAFLPKPFTSAALEAAVRAARGER